MDYFVQRFIDAYFYQYYNIYALRIAVDESVDNESELVMKQQTLWALCVLSVVSILVLSLVRLSGERQNLPTARSAPMFVSYTVPTGFLSSYDDGFRAGYSQGTSDGQTNCSINNPS